MLDPDALRTITRSTIHHYEDHAEHYCAGTRDHDVSQNVAALLQHLEGPAPYSILDLGCGPGRDLQTLRALGHEPVGLDGAARFVAMARQLSGCEVLHQDFLALDLPPARFDGIFANASLFHVPGQELPRVLRDLAGTLRDRGVLFMSNPRGGNIEGWQGARYGTYLDLEAWRRVVGGANFIELAHYYRPAGRPREEQPWLAMVWRKEVNS